MIYFIVRQVYVLVHMFLLGLRHVPSPACFPSFVYYHNFLFCYNVVLCFAGGVGAFVLVNSENGGGGESLIGFVYRVLWILKAMWIILSETINILRKLKKKKKTFWDAQKFFT